MIPILYEGNVTTFLNNGLGRLADAISCTVEEERNGTYELTMQYPITGVHYSDIAENRIIYAKTEDGGINQAFIIYKISKPLNGIVTINAQHISYLLNGFVVMPYTAVSLADAMSKINQHSVPAATGFTFSTDISSAVSFKLTLPKNIRSLLGGEEGSFLETYGGYDYYFNNFSVQLLANRGHDNGVTIRYGKNMTDLKAVSNTTNVYTGIVPYWADNEGHTVYVDGYVVYSDHAETYPYKYIKIVDFSNEFDSQPSAAQLLSKAQSYIANNDGWQIKHNIEVSFVSLAGTDEYKDIAPLERVKLCDTVTVIYSKLGISFKTKVIKTVYNVLLDRYDSITLGDATYTLAQALQQASNTPTVQETQSAIQRAVNNATNLIRGGLGGHVVMVADGNGLPQEILIMDTDDITTAQRVWRWNMGGLGYSDSGYDGTYGTAITMDGQIVANYITAGTFNGALIEAGTVSAEALSVEAKESLQTVHNYIGDVFNNINLWQYVGVAPYYETINDVKYLVIDGNNAGGSDRVYTPIDPPGNVKLQIHFKYHIDTEITISQQRFPFIQYTNMDGNAWWSWVNIPAQTIPANTDFEWDVTITPSNIDATKPAYFGFYRLGGAKIYLEELTVKSTVDSYAQAGMTFNSNGLELMAEEVRGNYAHNYLPYDIMSNSARWTIEAPGGNISFASTTYKGQNYDVAYLDAQNIESGYSFCTFKLNTDVVGRPLMHIKFIFHFYPDFTVGPSTYKDFLRISYKHDSSGYTQETIYSLEEKTYSSTNAEVELDFTPSLSVDRYEATPEIWFNVPNGAQVAIFGIEVYSDGETYKKATLSYTSDGLNSVVQAGSIISTINQSAESVDIEASKINLTGALSLHGDFTSYDTNDNSTYAFMDSGSISFYNSGANVFTIASLPLLGANAGIFFGDQDDAQTLQRYTYITQEFIQTPTFWVRKDGSQTQPTNAGQALVEGDFSVYGSSSFYGNVYNNGGGVVFISDQNKKHSIKDLVIEKAKSFLMKLLPREFKFNDDISSSGRKHHGFIAQEVKAAMYEDWGIYCEDKESSFIGLRYDELMADMVAVIQDQEKRISALERAVYDKSIN